MLINQTISRDDTQDLKIEAFKQDMLYQNSMTNANVNTLDEKIKITRDTFIKNQNNMSGLITDAHSKINELNRRLDRQSYALCLLFGIVIGLLAKVYFFS